MAMHFSGSSQYLSTASAPVSGQPMTMAAWARATSLTGTRTVVSAGQGGGVGSVHRNQLVMLSTGAFRLTTSTQATSAAIDTTSTSGVNEWTHVAGVVASLSSRAVYRNGVGFTNTSTINAYNSFGAIGVGAQPALAWATFWVGDIAEVGVWDVALTADEIASLADGVACRLIRPQSLVFYAPLIRDLVDVRGGLTITNNNTATVAVHPRVYA